MSENTFPDPETLKPVILNLSEPVVFRKMLQRADGSNIWKMLDWTLADYEDKFKDMSLPFRVGYNARTMEPQWEKDCAIKTMTLTEFIKEVGSTNRDKWYYFDYKYMHKWFKDNTEILESLSWKPFGFDKNGRDSTMWIGSTGAHTHCHQDSYGCNLVAQIYGRKQWLLFPPTSTKMLQPTRIPYEESTVYSKFNFYCPTIEDEEDVTKASIKAKLVTLEPGDVLLVPKEWWHYVESLDLTISVNIWLPLESDCQARLREALVNLVVNQLAESIPEVSEEENCLTKCLKQIVTSLQECRAEAEVPEEPCAKRPRVTEYSATSISEDYPEHTNVIKDLESSELRKYLKEKRERFSLDLKDIQQSRRDSAEAGKVNSPFFTVSKNVINAFSHPDIIDKVARYLLNETRNDSLNL